MNVFTTIILEFLFISSSILLLFKLRSKLGLAPLYILLGAVQYVQALSGKMVSYHVFDSITIYPGSVIIFSAVLFAVLLIYIKEGVASARALIIGVIISNFLLSLIFSITYAQEFAVGIRNEFDQPSVFAINYKFFITGTLILLLDFILMVIIYQYLILKAHKLNYFFILFLSLFTVLMFDAIAFNGILKFGASDFKNSLIGHVIGKSVSSLIFSLILYAYLEFIDDAKKSSSFIADQNRDIFAILMYRKKYLDLKIEKKEVEQKLTSQLETTLNNISDGFVSLDSNWCYTFVNTKAGEFLGREPKSLIGKHIWTEFPENVGLPFYNAYHNAVETQQTIYFEDYYQPFNKWFENRIYPTPDGLSIYFTDITNQKKTDLALKESENHLRTILETEPECIKQLNAKGELMYMNPAGLAMIEAENLEMVKGQSVINLIDPQHQHAFKKLTSDVFKGSGGQLQFEIIGLKGTKRWLETHAVPLKDSKGYIISLLGVTRDITNRKKAEEQIIMANQQLTKANEELNELRNQLEQENIYLKNELDLVFNYEEMVYGSAVFSNVLSDIEKVAPTNATVLLTGESGTGKELLARAIHNISIQSAKPLIKVNCSAIPRELIESELFGHKKGSFTGAYADKMGKFELAHEGTLFLDEIGELPLDIQPKLLRFLQEGEIEVVGGTGLKKLNVRIIAATNRNLQEEIDKNRFREDLYFRLNVFPIVVPPLRDRKDDIPLLVEHFVDKFNKKYSKNIKFIADVAMEKLKLYHWPGNIRELENLIERAAILSQSETLWIPGFESESQKSKQRIAERNLTLDAVQRNHILQVLEQCNWKITGTDGASKLLNVKPSTLRDKMTKLGIEKPNIE